MNILFDHCTPLPLRSFLQPHEVHSAEQQGWAAIDNGELLDRAEEEGYDVFVTTDANMLNQQVLKGRTFAVVVILSNRWPLIREVARSGLIRNLVENTEQGEVVTVMVPH